MKIWRDERELIVAGGGIAAASAFAFVLVSRNDWLANVGFLVLGALIAVFTTLLSERVRRRTQARDVAQSLYVELADRVARCCVDAEAPWKAYLDIKNCSPLLMSSFRLRKFIPDDPIIYMSNASQLALLGHAAPQALVQFYYRLAAWRRDLENTATLSDDYEGVEAEATCLLARRLRQTLRPGLNALQALQPLVDGYESIEASAIASYGDYRTEKRPSGSMRDRIAGLME